MKTGKWSYLLLLAAISVVAGCGSSDDNRQQAESSGKTEQPNKPAEPVELKVFASASITDEEFERVFTKPLADKYPNYKVKKIDKTQTSTIESLITTGDIPDLIWEGLTSLNTFKLLDLPADLTPLAKKHGFDFNAFIPGTTQAIQAYSDKGELLFFPFSQNVFAMHYNKTLFNKVGLPYLKDNMTWDEVIAVSKRMNIVQDGVQYQGLDQAGNNRLTSQLSLGYVDKATDRSLFATDPGWAALFRHIKSMYERSDGKTPKMFASKTHFLNDQTLGIFPDIYVGTNIPDLQKAVSQGLDWDMTTYPSFADKPGVAVGGFMTGFVLTKGGKQPDAAFRALQVWASENVATITTKGGRATMLNRPDIHKLMFDHELIKGKHTDNILTVKLPAPAPISIYDSKVAPIYSKYVKQFVDNTVDLNTALRMAGEEADKIIMQEKNR
ncbi:MAG: family 1 extracellular solute-binding protein [Paenibacillus sp.]|jgi:multiple sugar transport system substrate-binding protein|nr:family 1 extracellular solute-binding protein [Paenibacillus sp.]